MIFDAILQIEGVSDGQREEIKLLAMKIADGCEDKGLRAAAAHTAELAAPSPAVLASRPWGWTKGFLVN